MSTGQRKIDNDVGLRLAANIQRRRVQLKLSQEQFAKQARLGSAQTVSSIEQGERAVKAAELPRIARALHCSWTELLSDLDPGAQVAWRERPQIGAEVEQARFLESCRDYHLVEVWTDEVEEPCLPPVASPRHGADHAWARELALRVGEELGLGKFPAKSLLQALENLCGVKIFYFGNLQGSAASSRGAFGAAIVLNATEVAWRRNFSLAHELFHLVTWDVIQPEEVDGVYTWPKQTEALANEFAAALLLPTNSIIGRLEKHQQDHDVMARRLIEIAEEFDVSPTTVAWRLVSLKRLSATRAKELQRDPTFKRTEDNRLRTPEAEEREQVPGLPTRFVRLLKTAYLRGEVSASRVADMIGKKLADARDLLAQWEEDEASVRQIVRLT